MKPHAGVKTGALDFALALFFFRPMLRPALPKIPIFPTAPNFSIFPGR